MKQILIQDVPLLLKALKVKQRITATIIYAISAICLGGFLDALFGGESTTHYDAFVYASIASLILFAIASVLSLFPWRWGAIFGIAAAVISLPELFMDIDTAARCGFDWFFRYRSDTTAVIVSLIVSSIYSVIQMRRLIRMQENQVPSKSNSWLVLTIAYAAVVLLLANWPSIWWWLFRLRYGS